MLRPQRLRGAEEERFHGALAAAERVADVAIREAIDTRQEQGRALRCFHPVHAARAAIGGA